MKQCKCGREIEDKYIKCFECNQKDIENTNNKNIKKSENYLTILQQMNWNLGMISKTLQALLTKDKLEEIKKQMKK